MTLYSLPPLLTLVSFICLGAITVKQGRRPPANILFFVICLLGSFLYLDIFLVFTVASTDTALLISRLDHLFIVYLSPVYLHFFHAYLGVNKRNWLIAGAYAYAFGLMLFTQTDLYIKSMHHYHFGYFASGGPLYPLFGVMTLCVSVYVLYLIYQSIRNEKSSLGKYRLRYLFVGFGLLGVLNALNVLPISGYAVYPPGAWGFIPLTIFGIGLFRHDLLDTGMLIQKGLIYTLLTSFLTAVYAIIVIGAERLLTGFGPLDSVCLSMGFVLLASLSVAPLKEKIQSIVDRIFFREKVDYQETVKSVGRSIASMMDAGEISRLLIHAISRTMQAKNCRLYLMDIAVHTYVCQAWGETENEPFAPVLDGQSAVVGELSGKQEPLFRKGYISALMRRDNRALVDELDHLGAEIVIPIRNKGRLTGFMSLGEKRSGALFTQEDFNLLEILAGQAALALENARSYALLRRAKDDLEEKVADRTRELSKALHEKEMSRERLVKSESLAAIGVLVAGTAHELNNPLASVMSLLQSSVEDLKQWDGKSPLDEDFIDDLEFACRELEKAKHIVDSLLGLSRQTSTFTEEVSLNTVVKNALRVLHNYYKNKRVAIREDFMADLPVVMGNFANLGQMAVNIIKNAIDAVGENNGEIAITTGVVPDAGRVVFECRDTGPGIAEDIRLDIFKPFFTTKPVGQGTGLGLYICHEIVERHGGTITIEDNNGHGARFVVKIPVVKN